MPVTAFDRDIDRVTDKIERCLLQHEAYLKSIGMVVNSTKTELIQFSRTSAPRVTLRNGITYKKTIKAIGLTFNDTLVWTDHIKKTAQKTLKTTRSLSFLRRWVDRDSALQILTSQFFGQAYYAASVWLNNMLIFENWKTLERQHYTGLSDLPL